MSHNCFIHNAISKAISFNGALVWLTTFAVPKLIARLSCNTESGIVVLGDGTYIGHATVADLNCAPVEYLVQLGAFWEMP